MDGGLDRGGGGSADWGAVRGKAEVRCVSSGLAGAPGKSSRDPTIRLFHHHSTCLVRHSAVQTDPLPPIERLLDSPTNAYIALPPSDFGLRLKDPPAPHPVPRGSSTQPAPTHPYPVGRTGSCRRRGRSDSHRLVRERPSTGRSHQGGENRSEFRKSFPVHRLGKKQALSTPPGRRSRASIEPRKASQVVYSQHLAHGIPVLVRCFPAPVTQPLTRVRVRSAQQGNSVRSRTPPSVGCS